MVDFHATIKLITGEEIFALVSVDNSEDEPVVIMQNPVIMNIGITHFLGITLMISPYRLMIQIVKGDLDLHMSTFYMREKKK